MNTNIFCFSIGMVVGTSLVVSAQTDSPVKTPEQDKPVRISSGPVKKDYRIEVKKDTEGRPLRIRFLSPENRVIKDFSPEGVKVSDNQSYLVYKSTSHVIKDMSFSGGYVEKERILYNPEGEKKWTKIYRSYPVAFDEELGDPSFGDEGISGNGERIYFNFRDEQGKYCVVVYDTEGKERAKGCAENGLNDIQISPDGKLMAASTVRDGIAYIFFLDVDDGKVKFVKAQNDAGHGGAYPHAVVKTKNGNIPLPGYITIYWDYKSGGVSGMETLRYIDLPEDISTLFPEKGKRK